jgi:LacI family transcriptional regulator
MARPSNAPAVTLKSIAASVGCSIAAVSTVINGARGRTVVGPELRARIQATAAQMGYRAHFGARLLRSGGTLGVGVALGLIDQQRSFRGLTGELLSGIELGARQRGTGMLVLGGIRDDASAAIAALEDRRVSCLLAPGFLMRSMAALNECEGPVVWMTGEVVSRHPVVGLDTAPGLAVALAHLAELGHRRVAWIDAAEPSLHARGDQALVAAQQHGIALIRRVAPAASRVPSGPGHVHAHPGVTAGAAAAQALLAEGPLPVTAILAATEPLAFGVQAVCQESGLRVPRDVSIIGFDDIRADLVHPAMSVVSHMLPEIGQRAAELGLDLAASREMWSAMRGHREMIPARFIARASTGPAAR